MKNGLIFLVFMGCLMGCDNTKDVLVNIHTEFGTMKILLYDETPIHKKNFLELAKQGKYDSTEWHRIMENFMVQGGNINEKEGTVESDADRMPAEIIKGLLHTKGALAAARQPDGINSQKMSSSCQFYIVQGKIFTESELTVDQMALNQGLSQLMANPSYDTIRNQFVVLQQQNKIEEMNKLAFNYISLVESVQGISVYKETTPERIEAYSTIGGSPHLDNDYTIFGRVVEGLEVIYKLAAVQVGVDNQPISKTYMTMDLETMSKKDITAKYGYQYSKISK